MLYFWMIEHSCEPKASVPVLDSGGVTGVYRAIARQNPCLFGLNFSSCVASSGFFHLPKRKTPENKPFNVRLPCRRIA